MKTIFLSLGFFFIISSSYAQTGFKPFYKAHKQNAAFSIGAPAFLVNFFIDDESMKDIKPILKKVSHYHIMMFDSVDEISRNDFLSFVKNNSYEKMFKVSKEGSKISFYSLTNGKQRIKELIISLKTKDSFTLLGCKINISEEELSNLIISNFKDLY